MCLVGTEISRSTLSFPCHAEKKSCNLQVDTFRPIFHK